MSVASPLALANASVPPTTAKVWIPGQEDRDLRGWGHPPQAEQV